MVITQRGADASEPTGTSAVPPIPEPTEAVDPRRWPALGALQVARAGRTSPLTPG